jgi:hypothetical protein
MRRLIASFLFIFLLTGCNLPRSSAGPATAPYTECAWSWASQGLPELGARVEAAMQAAGLEDVRVSAEAYGENCLTAEGKVDHFAAMETDFRIKVPVTSLSDRQELGKRLEEILLVLDAFPAGSTPGSNPGYIGVTFEKDGQELNLWFMRTVWETAREKGLHGAALLEAVEKK